MEPKILLIGRTQEAIDVIVEELQKFERNVVGSNRMPVIERLIRDEKPDIAIIGAGLPDEDREKMSVFIGQCCPTLPVILIDRSEYTGAYDLIDFVNRKVIEFKIRRKIDQQQSR